MKKLPQIFENNRKWAEKRRAAEPEFFARLSKEQTPRYLWIGCADSRVPANEICDLDPGEMFVHRNIANLVNHTDFSALSVLQYAVDVLKVSDIIVCGHYGCGGVKAALSHQSFGLIDNWLRYIKDGASLRRAELEEIKDEDARFARMCELNVGQQVANVCYTTTVQEAWRRGQDLSVHGWIYSLEDGLLKDLDLCISEIGQLPDIYRVD